MDFPPFDDEIEPRHSASTELDRVTSQLPLSLDARQLRVRLKPVLRGPLAGVTESLELEFGELKASFSALGPRVTEGEAVLSVRSLRLCRPLKSKRDEMRLMDKLLGIVLDARANPEIRFRPLSLIHIPPARPSLRAARREAEGTGQLRVVGELAIRSMRHRLTLDFSEARSGLWVATGSLQMQAFGVVPPRHFMGAIQVEGALPFEVEVDLRVGGSASAATFDLSGAPEN